MSFFFSVSTNKSSLPRHLSIGKLTGGRISQFKGSRLRWFKAQEFHDARLKKDLTLLKTHMEISTMHSCSAN